MSGPVRKECLNFVISEKREEFRLIKKYDKMTKDKKEKEVGYIDMLVSSKGCYLVKIE